MSMALAEVSIQSLLDFLRLNLWIWFDGFHKKGSLDKGRGGLEGIENEGEKIGNCVNNSLCKKSWAVMFDCQIGPFSKAKKQTNKKTKQTKGYPKDNCHISLFLFLFFIFTYLCSSLSICLAREILFLMEDIKDTSTGKESSSFPATQNLRKNKIKKTNMNKNMKQTDERYERL